MSSSDVRSTPKLVPVISIASGKGTGNDSLLMRQLRVAVESSFDIQKVRLALANRGADEETIAALKALEDRYAREAKRLLRKTAIGPWLASRKSAGLHMARVVAVIEDPRRFPGQRCTGGQYPDGQTHYFPPGYKAGENCPVSDDDGERCPGVMEEPRNTSGVRSLWHFLGVSVDDGHLPRRRKGIQATWNPKLRTSILMPDVGIAAQIVRQPGHPYRPVYDQAKARLARERGVDSAIVSAEALGAVGSRVNGRTSGSDIPRVVERTCGAEKNRESEARAGSDNVHVFESASGAAEGNGNGKRSGSADARVNDAVVGASEGADERAGNGSQAGTLRPFEIESRARIIAAKALLGDMLVEWKRIVGHENA